MTDFRAFIAIKLPDPIRNSLDQTSKMLKGKFPIQGARWVPAGNIHLTIHFLGEIAAEGIPTLSTALAEEVSKHPSLTVTVHGLGVFPNPRRPRVLWVGIQSSEELGAMYQGLGLVLTQLGYPAEDRPFSPHLTLARLPQPIAPDQAQIVQTLLQQNDSLQIGTFTADQVYLIRSELMPSGSRYSHLGAYPLIPKG